MATEDKQRQTEGWVDAKDFSWEQYLKIRNGVRAFNGHLFRHQHFLERTLSEHIFRPGRRVRAHVQEEGTWKWLDAHIAVTFGGQAYVEIVSPVNKSLQIQAQNTSTSENVRTELVNLDQLELVSATSSDRNAGTINELIENESEYQKIIQQNPDWLNKKLHTFIENGQFFEIQENFRNSNLAGEVLGTTNELSVLKVHTVRVAEHSSGLVMAEYEDGRRELVNITSERCHPLGWTGRQDPGDGYRLVDEWAALDAQNAHKVDNNSAIPNWLFTYNPLEKHKMEAGMLLEMLDPLNRLCFIPAYVTEVINSHYFKVRPIRDVRRLSDLLNGFDRIFHRNSPGIFPVGWCFKNQIRLTFPKGMNQSDVSFSYSALRLRLSDLLAQRVDNCDPELVSNSGAKSSSSSMLEKQVPRKVQPRLTFAPDNCFELPKMAQKRLECIRYCEVQDEDEPTSFYPGAIIRSRQHLIWIHINRDEHSTAHRPAKIYCTNSPELHSCGFAGNGVPGLRIFASPVRTPTSLRERAQLTTTFSSQRTSAFKGTKRKFLSEMWLKSDLWLPAIHLNSGCFAGPFISREKLESLAIRTAPAPLPHAINTLLKDIILCGTRVRELVDLLAADKHSKELQMMIKLKHQNRRTRVSVEICEHAIQFPGWLRMLLIRLDACPNLFSLEKKDKCPFNCSSVMSSLPYMTQAGHANTASQLSSQQQSNKLMQAAQQLKKTVHNKRTGNKKWRTNRRHLEGEKISPKRKSKRLSIAVPVVDDDLAEDEDVRLRKRRGTEGTTSSSDDDGDGESSGNCSTGTSETMSSSNEPNLEKEGTAESAGKQSPKLASVEVKGTNWRIVWTEDSRTFFHNSASQISTWKRPPELCNRADVDHLLSLSAPVSPEITGQMLQPVSGGPKFAAYSPRPLNHPRANIVLKGAPKMNYAGPLLYGPSPPPMLSYHPNVFAPYGSGHPFKYYYGQQMAGGPSTSGGGYCAVMRPPLAPVMAKSPSNIKYPPVKTNPKNWDCDDLYRWIDEAGFHEIAVRLLDEEVDGASLLLFNLEHFKEMGLKLGPAVKMMDAVENLKLNASYFDDWPQQ